MGAAEYDKFMDDAKADKEHKHKTEVKMRSSRLRAPRRRTLV